MNICCNGCKKHPSEIGEYNFLKQDEPENMKWDELMDLNEGTYNKENGHFLCTNCYIKAGMPLGVAE